MTNIVFVHGRSQEHKDPVSLKQEWIDAWGKGLARSGLDLPLPASSIRFPYFGDTLEQLSRDAASRDVPDIIVHGGSVDAEGQAFLAAYLRQVQRKCGIDDEEIRAAMRADAVEMGPQDSRWVHGLLQALDGHVPGASGAAVATFTADVYQYLVNPGIRDVMDTGVRQAITGGVDTIVVSHSLGTVIAYNVLRRDGELGGYRVPLFVTLGSPLGVDVVRRGLAPIRRPSCVGRWVNALDPRDIVALYPLDHAHFDLTPPIENYDRVENWTPNRHGIVGYLDDAHVARLIHDAC
jgi:hypothetical protein